MVQIYLFWLHAFVMGGLTYGSIEMLWRKRTHISMIITGGLCFCMLILIQALPIPFLIKCLLGGTGIMASEFVAGCIVNLYLGLNVWDYSGEKVHLMGQICPKYFVLWCALSMFVLLLI